MVEFHIFGNFPEDIRRLIFEVAFEESYPRVNHLALVSREISTWIQPLIYRHVVLTTLNDDTERFDNFVNTFRHGSRSKDFYGNSVKAVFIDDLIFEDFATEFLPVCKNLVSLSYWPKQTGHLDARAAQAIKTILTPGIFPFLRKLSLLILRAQLPLELTDVFHHPLAQNLTHLNLFLGMDLSWEGLKQLQSLQYLSLQPISSLWLPTNYPETGRWLEALLQLMVPNLPPDLRCFMIWLPEPLIFKAAREDAMNKLQRRQTPVFANIVHGWLDPRIVIASCAHKAREWGRGMSSLHVDEIRDFLDQTITIVNEDFDQRLIWDNATGQGGDKLIWGIERILHRRREAILRICRSHWHQGSTLRHQEGNKAFISVSQNAQFPLFRDFPEDIRRLIFEIAFENSKNTANYLTLVSRETHSWIEPLIYRRIIMCQSPPPDRVGRFIYTLHNGRKEKHYYATLIQSLSIDQSAIHRIGNDFLSLCDNIVSFAGSWSSRGSEPVWGDVLRSILNRDVLPRLHKLSLQDMALPNLFSYPVCQSLTHLDIVVTNRTAWEGFETLNNLKHIRVNALSQLPVSDDPIETSQGVREAIIAAVHHFPPALESFVFLVDPGFICAAAVTDCEFKLIQGRPPIFADIVRGGIDLRVVLSCKSPPVRAWSEQRMSQRQIDEIYDFLNQVVPYPFLYLPWDIDDPFGVQKKESYWLDLVRDIISRRREELDMKVRRRVEDDASERQSEDLTTQSDAHDIINDI